jgi:hypothetical protein
MKRIVQVSALECQCEVQGCGKAWLTLSKRPPSHCKFCRSREWDGVKKKRKPAKRPKIELPKPLKVRNSDDTEFF